MVVVVVVNRSGGSSGIIQINAKHRLLSCPTTDRCYRSTGPWLLPDYHTGVTMSDQVCSFSASFPRSRDMGFLGVADGGLEIGTPGFAGCRYPVLISQRGQRQIPYSLTPREEQGNERQEGENRFLK